MTDRVCFETSVVICSYTEVRLHRLVAAVESVAAQDHPAAEIIVVVDHNPQLLERLRSLFPEVVVVPNFGPRGLSGARNSGVSVARYGIVAFLDDDAVAEPAWLARLCTAYDDPSVIGVGGLILADWEGGRPSWFPREFDWVVGCSYTGMPQSASPVRNLIGANMSFRREQLVEAGCFRSGMGRIGTVPLGCEETELSIRIQQKWPKAVLLYDPTARVRHWVPVDRTRISYFRSRCFSEGLSKAMVSQLVGRRDGLKSEVTYTARTLTCGAARGITEFLTRRDVGGLGRATAIVAGLAWTTAGYLAGIVSTRKLVSSVAGPVSTRVVGDHVA